MRALLQKTVESRGGFIPSGLDVTREVDQRLRNLEDFCQKISDREIDRYFFKSLRDVSFCARDNTYRSRDILETCPNHNRICSTTDYSKARPGLDFQPGLGPRKDSLNIIISTEVFVVTCYFYKHFMDFNEQIILPFTI